MRVLAVGQGCSTTHNGTRDGFKNSDRKHLPRVFRTHARIRMRLGLTGFINNIGSGSEDLNMLACDNISVFYSILSGKLICLLNIKGWIEKTIEYNIHSDAI